MRRVLVGAAIAVFLAVACFYILVNYSAFTRELTCNGHWKQVEQSKEVAEVAHVQLTEYRWWVHLWSESDGNVAVQTEKLPLASYISFVHKIGRGSLALFEFRDGKAENLRGGYREANGEMTVKFSDSLTFVGTTCRPR